VSGAGPTFVGSTDDKLYAFDATGTTGCSGTPKACTPLWTMATGGPIVSSPGVMNSVTYVGSSDHDLYAVDATGATNCSGTPKVCTPLWTAATSGVVRSSPALTSTMVYIGSDDDHVDAYDATGSTNCSGTPKTCTPIWSTATGGAVASSPSVAKGVVYFGSLDHSLYADKPWTAPRTACAANPHSGLSPCQLEGAYELPSTVAGAGRTVAIVDAFDDPNAETDLATYRTQYGLPACTTANGCFKKLNQTGQNKNYPAGNQGWGEEISLDLDTVSSICPLCHITLVEATNNSLTNLTAAEVTAGGTSPTAISNSWGSSEFSGENTLDSNFSFPGIMVTVSTGDNGFGATWPASDPNVTAVGGTVLSADSSTRGWSETVWSGAASGCSSQEAKQPWQHDSGCTNRTIADVSALAGSPGETIYDTYGGDTGWEDFGGTSLASPIIASVYALAYPDKTMAATYASPTSLFDVTSGSNGSCGGTYLCTGVAGYDGPTGLGTPCGTTDFGTGPFVTPSCSTLVTSSAHPASSKIQSTPALVFTPVCTAPKAGFASCDADRITPG
jgi:PQQ-like domain